MTNEDVLKGIKDYITTKKAEGHHITALDWLLIEWKWIWANTRVYRIHTSGRNTKGKRFSYSYRKVVTRIH